MTQRFDPDRLKALRERNDLTQDALGKKAKINGIILELCTGAGRLVAPAWPCHRTSGPAADLGQPGHLKTKPVSRR
jgi:hypothetical protein